MSPLQDNIFPIRLGSCTTYYLKTPTGGVLIDAGNANKVNHLNSVLLAHEMELSDIKLIILTHTHHDHVGSLAELKRRTNAQILVHSTEAGFLRAGRTPLPKGTMVWTRIMVSVGRLFQVGAYDPVEPDMLVEHDISLRFLGIDAMLMPTPGHTLGSISIMYKKKYAFVGDNMFNIRPETVYPPFANHPQMLLQSWRRYLDGPCSTFFPAHGKPISRERLLHSYDKAVRHFKKKG